MKKNPKFLFLIAGAFLSLSNFSSPLSAQTSFSDNPDMQPSTLNLDQDLEKAMQKAETKPSEASESLKVSPQSKSQKGQPKVSQPNLFLKTFYAAPSKKSETITTNVQGFTVVHMPSRKMDAEYAVITDFGGEVVKTRFLKGLKTMDDVNDYIQKNLETSEDTHVEIRKMKLPGENAPTFYWVGDKSFSDLIEAKKWVIQVRQQVAKVGGNFEKMVIEAQTPVAVEGETVMQIDKSVVSNQKKEEDMVLKWADQLDLGEQLWGPLQGDAAGQPILWQSFGEMSYRKTNLEDNKYNSVGGFWSNIVVFRGIRFPLNTIDPFVENVTAMEAVSEDYKSHSDFFIGAEWRPLARNPWLENFRPVGNISLLKWMRNYRFFVKYGNRYNIKDQFASQDWDYQYGVQLFYEFGTELPDLTKPAPENIFEYAKENIWGEYFADYHYARTDFSTDKNSRAITMGNSLILGVKLPGIPLPENPINDQFQLMPYVHLNQTWNDTHSFSYQNYYYVSAGVRWMPFNTLRYKENEWLSKIKVFGEWIAMGKTQYVKQDNTETGDFVRNDLRFGLSFASRRY